MESSEKEDVVAKVDEPEKEVELKWEYRGKFKKGRFECECGQVVQYKHVLARHINQRNAEEGGSRHKEKVKDDKVSAKTFNF